MPKPKGRKPFSELSKKAQLEKVQGIIDRTDRVLRGPNRSNNKQVRARAEAAERAASSVKSRITGKPIGSGGRSKKGSVGSKLAKGARGFLDLVKSAAGVPGKFKKGFEEVTRKSKGE